VPIENVQLPESSPKAFVARKPFDADSPIAIAKELLRMRARLVKEGPEEQSRLKEMGFFESVLVHSDKPVAVLKEGVHVFVNPCYAAFMGQAENVLIGTRLVHLLENSCRLTLRSLLSALDGPCVEVDFLARIAGEAHEYPEWHWHLARFSQGNTAYVRVEPNAYQSLPINAPSPTVE
jgi:PAS domain-containing protein